MAGRVASFVDSLTVNILQRSILHAVNRGELHKGCLSCLGSLGKKNDSFKPRIRVKQMAWASVARKKAGDESRPVSLNKESVTLVSLGLRVKACAELLKVMVFLHTLAKYIPGNLINIDVLMSQAFVVVENRPNVFLHVLGFSRSSDCI